MGPQVQASGRLVEADVTVSSDAKQLEVDAAQAGNHAFESRALPVGVACVAGEKVHVIGRDVDMAEQMLLHESAKAAGIGGGQPDELVEVHRVDQRKI